MSSPSDGHTPLRRAELLAALSLAADLGMGHPLENAQRTAIVTVALGLAAGVSARDLKDAYFLAFLRHVGCTADAPIAADVFGGDEIEARGWLALVDWGEPADVLRVLMRNMGAGKSTMQRARLIANLFIKMPRLNRTAESHCEVAQSLADDLGCSVRVREALAYSFERWDGKGIPRKKKGGAIPLPMRLVQVADDAQAFHRAGGVDAAVAMLAERGRQGAGPDAGATSRAGGGGAAGRRGRVVGVGRGDRGRAGRARLRRRLRRSTARCRRWARSRIEVFVHARAFDGRGGAGGGRRRAAGAGAEAVAEVRRAGYVHDVGRAGVSAGVWEKEGPLTDGEWEKVRMHAYYTERILARPPLLARLGTLGLARPRTDGWHRLSAPARGGVAAGGSAAPPGGGHVPGDARDAAAPALDRA